MGLIFDNFYVYTKERNEFIENFLKLSDAEYLFNNFSENLQNNPKPETLRKDLIIMASLVDGVKNKDLKLEIYEQIISSLVLLMCAGYEQ